MLKKNEYKLYALRPYPVVFWVNNMGILYQWCPDEQDFVKSSLEQRDLDRTKIIPQSSTNLRELVKIAQREKAIFDFKILLGLPKTLIVVAYLTVKMAIKDKIREWKRRS